MALVVSILYLYLFAIVAHSCLVRAISTIDQVVLDTSMTLVLGNP